MVTAVQTAMTQEARGGRQAIADAWAVLADIPDPEIPVVSIVDLGIVRGVAFEGDVLIVATTPTYSGCPATAVIALGIEDALRRRGFARVMIKSQLSPPWTTDWISDAGREKLKAYGIAPPVGGARCVGDLKSPIIECPHCGSTATEQVSRFGSTPCKAHWRCRDCLEPFDHFKNF
jgi:ring-1,2-phenylacetyl-CoA epoxidase subunit PaaD